MTKIFTTTFLKVKSNPEKHFENFKKLPQLVLYQSSMMELFHENTLISFKKLFDTAPSKMFDTVLDRPLILLFRETNL